MTNPEHGSHDPDWLKQSEAERSRRGFFKWVAGFLGTALFLAPVAVAALPFLAPLFRRKGQRAPGADVRVARLDQVADDGVPHVFPVFGAEVNVWTYQSGVKIGEVVLVRKPGTTEITAFSTICPHLGCAVRVDSESGNELADNAAENSDQDGNGEQAQQAAEQRVAIFRCPCHNSTFNVDGSKQESQVLNPSPRGLDQLPPPENGPDGSPNENGSYVFSVAPPNDANKEGSNTDENTADGDDAQADAPEPVEYVYVRFQEYYTGRSEKVAKQS